MLLCIDTASRSSSVAVLTESEVFERALPGRDTAAHLASIVSGLIESYGPPSRYAVDLGPGSFTGLRVGLAFAKGLARSLDGPALGLFSLDVLAEGLELESHQLGLTCVPASAGGVFAALYRGGPNGPNLQDELPMGLYRPEHVEAACAGLRLRAGGEGLERLSSGFLHRLDLAPSVEAPSAAAGARLAARKFAQGEASRLRHLEPAYFQLSAAEENLRKKEGL